MNKIEEVKNFVNGTEINIFTLANATQTKINYKDFIDSVDDEEKEFWTEKRFNEFRKIIKNEVIGLAFYEESGCWKWNKKEGFRCYYEDDDLDIAIYFKNEELMKFFMRDALDDFCIKEFKNSTETYFN